MIQMGLAEQNILEVVVATVVEFAPGLEGAAAGRVALGGGFVEGIGLQLPGAALLPFGGGHFLNGAELERTLGGEVGEEVVEEVLETIWIFVVEEDGGGGEPVFEGVERGFGAGLVGEGSARAGTVAAGGRDLSCGRFSHESPFYFMVNGREGFDGACGGYVDD